MIVQRKNRTGAWVAGAVWLGGLVVFGAQDSNLVAAVKADGDAGWESVFTPSNQIPFHINLYMKHGLYYCGGQSCAREAFCF
jgi:hypothetical protein